MKIKNIVCTLLLSSVIFTGCDGRLDLTPKGQSTLSSAADLEMLFNNATDLGLPYVTLGIVCNESLGMGENVPMILSQRNTVACALLAYDESIDRASLTLTDERYTNAYKYINYMNTIIEKMPEAEGDEAEKKTLVAEARVMRAYLHWLLVNIYAQQYDTSTAGTEGGIAYVTDIDVTRTKRKLTVAEVYDKILEDCTDDILSVLPQQRADVLRGDRAWGYAVRAKVLMQMKRYAEALPYAEKALAINDIIDDRSVVATSGEWILPRQYAGNYIYFKGQLFPEVISAETVRKFETGDYVKDYAFMMGNRPDEEEGSDTGDEYVPVNSASPAWNSSFGMLQSGVAGVSQYFSFNTYVNSYGITSDRMYYTTAECLIRTGKIQEGIDLINKIRRYRIDELRYKTLEASDEATAMEHLQKAKWIECIGSYENFFDCKRWNTEPAYRRAISRTVMDMEGNASVYTIEPDSKLWIFPFPQDVVRKNPTLTQNF